MAKSGPLSSIVVPAKAGTHLSGDDSRVPVDGVGAEFNLPPLARVGVGPRLRGNDKIENESGPILAEGAAPCFALYALPA